MDQYIERLLTEANYDRMSAKDAESTDKLLRRLQEHYPLVPAPKERRKFSGRPAW